MRKTYSDREVSEQSTKTLYKTAAVFLTVIALLIMSIQAWKFIDFNRHCSGHLKRAADANSIPLAISELEIAVNYMEQHELTEGYSSVLYETPDQDIGFWYKNINSALKDLKTLDPKASSLEKSNVLLKLRETLLDHSGQAEQVTTPRGVSIFPHNVLFAGVWLFLLFGGSILFSFYMKEMTDLPSMDRVIAIGIIVFILVCVLAVFRYV